MQLELYQYINVHPGSKSFKSHSSKKIKTNAFISSLLNIDDGLPDCTENPFGAYNDLVLIKFPAKRL
jgi:hypothetical protein